MIIKPMTEKSTGKEISRDVGTSFESTLWGLVLPIRKANGIIMNKS